VLDVGTAVMAAAGVAFRERDGVLVDLPPGSVASHNLGHSEPGRQALAARNPPAAATPTLAGFADPNRMHFLTMGNTSRGRAAGIDRGWHPGSLCG
jgi:hypothetical protein